jgi:hypothetical protein
MIERADFSSDIERDVYACPPEEEMRRYWLLRKGTAASRSDYASEARTASKTSLSSLPLPEISARWPSIPMPARMARA